MQRLNTSTPVVNGIVPMTTCVYTYRGSPIGSAKIHINYLISELEELECKVYRHIPYDLENRDDQFLGKVSKLLEYSPLILRNMVQLLASKSFEHGLSEEVMKECPDFLYERYALFCRAGIEVSKRMDLPHILEVNSIIHTLDPDFISVPLIPLAKKTEPVIFRSTDHIIAITNQIRDELLEMGVREERVSVIHNGVDPDVFQPNPEQSKAVRKELGFTDEDCVIVISMGFNHRYLVDPVVDTLIASTGKLIKENENLKILVLGGGRRFGIAKKRILRNLDTRSVTFLGMVPHHVVPKYLVAGDLAYIPWHVEFSSPLKLFEYMSMGLPLIVPNLPGIMEVVDEAFAWSFAINHPLEAEEVLKYALESRDSFKERGTLARECVMGHFSWKSIARKVLNVAEKLLFKR